MTVLILHGIMGRAGENWGQWLSDELQKDGFVVIMPTLPEADHPDRQTWLATIKTLLKDIDAEELIIVAHSLGVTSALDYIEQSEKPLRGMVSVSGFAQDYGLELNSYFLKERSIDLAKVRSLTKHIAVFYGDNDPYVTQAALQDLADQLHTKAHIIANGGHLNASAGFTKFEQLLSTVQSFA